ncbi:hypothetical protein U8607_04175 [Methylobacterium durans]|uniref:hypothetical protein n=1 Tax=Methylobacterium durans TaxID=2202825 RepID=UPI002AFDD4AA|nr:hypothetical protein [Methylobacterium durans]MEA1831274.1 hypothetical protein [Methylobacterium durans]
MDALGLPDFETEQHCTDRQQRMVRALARAKARRGLTHALARCTADACGSHRCREGCHHAARRLRLALVPQADRLLRAQPGPLLNVTLVHPAWEAAYEAGPEAISIPTVKQWLKRRLTRLTRLTGASIMAAGSFEVSLNIGDAGTKTWAGHVHFNCAGATRKGLHAALAIGSSNTLDDYAKPLVIKEVTNTARQQAYALKRFAEQRMAYKADNGRRARRSLPLDTADQLTFDRWLCELSSGERVFLFGCKRLNGQLVGSSR